MCAVMAGRSLPGPSPLGDSRFAESRRRAGSAAAERFVHGRGVGFCLPLVRGASSGVRTITMQLFV